jgi:uncharacterized RDD family membrane protein YckC
VSTPTELGGLAGIVTRLLAALIDIVVVAALTAAVFGAVVAGVFVVNPVSFSWPHALAAETTLVTGVVAIAYLTVGWATAGRTVGGAVLGVRVVGRGGGRLGWTRAACRAVLCVLAPLACCGRRSAPAVARRRICWCARRCCTTFRILRRGRHLQHADHVQPKVLDLGQYPVQVRVVDHLPGDHGLRRGVVHGHVDERALCALRQPPATRNS